MWNKNLVKLKNKNGKLKNYIKLKINMENKYIYIYILNSKINMEKIIMLKPKMKMENKQNIFVLS